MAFRQPRAAHGRSLLCDQRGLISPEMDNFREFLQVFWKQVFLNSGNDCF